MQPRFRIFLFSARYDTPVFLFFSPQTTRLPHARGHPPAALATRSIEHHKKSSFAFLSFEGKSAIEATQTSITVLMVDCHRRNPVIHSALRAGNALASGGYRTGGYRADRPGHEDLYTESNETNNAFSKQTLHF